MAKSLSYQIKKLQNLCTKEHYQLHDGSFVDLTNEDSVIYRNYDNNCSTICIYANYFEFMIAHEFGSMDSIFSNVVEEYRKRKI